MKLRIALLQMHVEMGNPKVNFAHARDMMEKAMEKKPDIRTRAWIHQRPAVRSCFDAASIHA